MDVKDSFGFILIAKPRLSILARAYANGKIAPRTKSALCGRSIADVIRGDPDIARPQKSKCVVDDGHSHLLTRFSGTNCVKDRCCLN